MPHPGPWRWLLFAVLPSSLLLSVTTYLTTDVAAIPLLWVVPLVLYLTSFMLTFARRPPLPHRWLVRVLPVAAVLGAVTLLVEATEPLALLLLVHLVVLFVVAMVCHGELARLRPEAAQLTRFYFWLAAGGALGGVFNGLVAPLAFYGLAEYPVVLVLVCLAAPPAAGGERPALARGDFLWPIALGLFTAAILLTAAAWGLEGGRIAAGAMFAVPVILCYVMQDRPPRFGLALAALFLAATLHPGLHGRVVYQERSFFGVHRVAVEPGGGHVLVHGNTVHGLQRFGPGERGVPRMYYHRTGPAGKVFQRLLERGDRRPVAVVGLGAGSLAAYGQAGQEFTFYEIDPAVIRIASDPALFTFLADSLADIRLVPGDARLTLAKAPAHQYGLIVIDAFSSDAIPTHLLTREALEVYLSKLADDGLLLFHVSNRYLDLAPVLAVLAADAGLEGQIYNDLAVGSAAKAEGKLPSQWVLLTRHAAQRMPPGLWEPLRPRPGARVWTDDYCDQLGAFRWGAAE
jgi:hypothetical protein